MKEEDLSDEEIEFMKFVQKQIFPCMNAITQHPYFAQLHLDIQTNFLSSIHEAFENDLGFVVDPLCNNFNEIFQRREDQDPFTQTLLKLSRKMRIKNNSEE